MPIQIKKRVIPAAEKHSCVLAIITALAGLGFGLCFIILLPDIDGDSASTQRVKTIAVSSLYAIFVLLCIVHAVVSLVASKKTNKMGLMLGGSLSGVSAFLALLTARFMAALLFSGLGREDLADKVIGDNTYSAFITAQGAAFACLVIALAIMLVIAVISIIDLAKT
ncbi:MAG: hypothetical protein IJ746_05885 [Ruminococcus sp.]|nr:hypothetical protein [Ruminococcus sp.]